jgi:protein phosphatase 2C family protein 2/3
MGQILAAPVTTKHSTEGEDKRIMFGASSMQGWRISKSAMATSLINILTLQ